MQKNIVGLASPPTRAACRTPSKAARRPITPQAYRIRADLNGGAVSHRACAALDPRRHDGWTANVAAAMQGVGGNSLANRLRFNPGWRTAAININIDRWDGGQARQRRGEPSCAALAATPFLPRPAETAANPWSGTRRTARLGNPLTGASYSRIRKLIYRPDVHSLGMVAVAEGDLLGRVSRRDFTVVVAACDTS
jgi:hypothetical protein